MLWSTQRGQKQQKLHGCSLGMLVNITISARNLPFMDLQQLLNEGLQQPFVMGALCWKLNPLIFVPKRKQN